MLPKFVYVHLLKTGGGSFLRTLIRNWSEYAENWTRDGYWKYKDELIPKLVKNGLPIINVDDERYIRSYENSLFIYGHFKKEKYDHLGWPFVTFVRNPVNRIVSQYNYWRRWYPNTSLIDFVKIYPNHMYNLTGGDLSQFAFVGLTEKHDESFNKFCKVFGLKKSKDFKYHRRRANNQEAVKKLVISLSRMEKKIIKEYNRKDMRLYKQALEMVN